MNLRPHRIFALGIFAIATAFSTAFVGAQSPPRNAQEALTNYRWRWDDSKTGPGNREGIFGSDGFFRNPAGAGTTTYRWAATGANSFTLTNGNFVMPFTFNDDFTRFEGNTRPKNSHVVGTRLGPVNGQPEMPTGRPEVPVSAPSSPPPSSPPTPAPPSALPPQKDLPMIEVLSDQAPNVANWITAPLDRDVPAEIWQNMTFLKEALRDEAVKSPTASPAAYGMAVRLCFTLVANLEERRAAETLSGGDDVLHQKSNLTEWRRDHLTWPMYFLERDERAERRERGKNTKVFMKDLKIQEWANRSRAMRGVIDTQYSQFRDALRQSPARK